MVCNVVTMVTTMKNGVQCCDDGDYNEECCDDGDYNEEWCAML